jgi:hypothetical protein
MADHYAACRFNPFSPLPATVKIPDGRGKAVIVREYKTAHNIVVADKEQLECRISPTYPYPIRFHQTGAATTTVNGSVLGVPSTLVAPPATTSPLLGTPTDSAMSYLFGTNGVTNAVGDATSFIGARFISIGYRVFYTGTASAAQGVVVVDNLSARVVTSANENPALVQYAYSPAGAQNNVAIAAGTAPYIVIDSTPFEYKTLTTDQVVLRPENGVHGILKMAKLASDHPFAPWYDTGAICMQSVTGGSNSYDTLYAPSTNVSSNIATRRLGNFFWDDAFMETNLRLPPGAFRIELTCCIEMECAMQSSLIDMCRPSPMYNDMALKRDMYLNSLVVPAPFSSPPLDTRFSQMSISGRPRVRKARKSKPQKQQQQNQQKPKQTGKTARRRRNRQRRRNNKQ